MAQKIYGIDFGTGTIKVYRKGKGIILLERNVVSTIGKDRRPIAIGEDAYEMYEKEPPSIHVSFPLHHGVIAQMQDMIALWDFMNQRVNGKKKHKGCEYYLAVPADITEVEKQAYSRIISEGEAKPKKVYLIDKPIANSYGLGLDLEHSRGILIVDLGADTTEITVLSLGGIVVSKLIPYGGNYFDTVIRNYIRKRHNFVIGNRTAEQVKKKLIVALPQEHLSTRVIGRNVVRGLPDEVTITSDEVYPLVQDAFEQIANSVQSMIEHIPPEISSQIRRDGIFLTGGSSCIAGFDRFLSENTDLSVHCNAKPQETVVNGLGYLAEHPKVAAKYALALS